MVGEKSSKGKGPALQPGAQDAIGAGFSFADRQPTTPASARAFRSTDPDHVTQFLSSQFAPHEADYSRTAPFSAQVQILDFSGAVLIDAKYNVETTIHPQDASDFFLVHSTIEGGGCVKYDDDCYDLSRNRLQVSQPVQGMSLRRDAESRLLTVRLPRRMVEDYLSDIIEQPINTPLRFFGVNEDNGVFSKAWCDHVAHMLNLSVILTNERIARQNLQILSEMLLTNVSNNYSEQLLADGETPLPRHVFRAREIVDASLDEKISLVSLAREVGVSIRCLQNGFRNFLGVSPNEYIRLSRIRKLHASLLRAAPGQTVTTLMLECGINNFGRYAKYYREQYRELPSDVLQRAQQKQ